MAQMVIREGLDGAVVPDTWLYSLIPDDNYGSDEWLRIGHNTGKGGVTDRAILRFDLSVIPANATITAVKLTLDVFDSATSAEAAKLRRLTHNWTESIATWLIYAQANGSSSWATPGGDYTATDEVDWTMPTSTGSLDITGLKTLAEDAIANRGEFLHMLLMREVEDVDSFIDVRSGEYGLDETKRPYLTIDYEPPPSVPPVTTDELTAVGPPIAVGY